MIHQSVNELLFFSHEAQQFGRNRLWIKPMLIFGLVLATLDLRRKSLPEEVASHSGLKRNLLGSLVVKRYQAPHISVPNHRNRHGRGDPHVVQVLKVDRRDAAQGGVTEIQRGAGFRVQRRLQRNGLVAAVWDEPQWVKR